MESSVDWKDPALGTRLTHLSPEPPSAPAPEATTDRCTTPHTTAPLRRRPLRGPEVRLYVDGEFPPHAVRK